MNIDLILTLSVKTSEQTSKYDEPAQVKTLIPIASVNQ